MFWLDIGVTWKHKTYIGFIIRLRDLRFIIQYSNMKLVVFCKLFATSSFHVLEHL